jgi:MFS transporter, DHA1 family, tetracycline resistance protein
LFLGRIIEGLTGGSISTLFAYVADITPPAQRDQYFGTLGAATGVGFICGPLIGGLAAKFSYATPLYVGAALTFANVVYGYFFMPESLGAKCRTQAVPMAQLNPLKQLSAVFALGQVRLLPRFGEARVGVGAMLSEIVGYLLLALSARIASAPLLVIGFVLFGFGESSFGPSVAGLISRRVGPRDQGRVQGSNQSVEAVARMAGPLLGGQLYISLGRSSPYVSSALLVTLALVALWRARSNVRTVILSAEPEDQQ